MAEHSFRADLYYRLRVVQLELPPLRARGDDILLLAQHFLQLHAQRYGTVTPRLSEGAAQALLRHAWPGNVRELRNTLEQAVLMLRGPTLEAEHLTLAKVEAVPSRALPAAADATTLPDIARQALLQALERNGWNVTRAARSLGISRDTLRYRIEKFNLSANASS